MKNKKVAIDTQEPYKMGMRAREKGLKRSHIYDDEYIKYVKYLTEKNKIYSYYAWFDGWDEQDKKEVI